MLSAAPPLLTTAAQAETRPFRAAFVLEQTLGHVTHAQNLKRYLGACDSLDSYWLDVNFRPTGLFYKVPPLSRNWSLRGSLLARRQLRDVDRDTVDAVFIHTLTVGLLAGRSMKQIPTVLSLDATPLNFDSVGAYYDHRVGRRWTENAKRAMVRRAVSAAQRFVVWSEWVKSSLVQDYGADPDRVHVIAPGADLSLFNHEDERRPGPARVLFVGGNFKRKGGDLLLRAFNERLRGRAELHVVTGDDVPAQPGVFVYRNVGPNSPQLLELFNTADVFALPTHADCLAVVLGEAMAASLPIVTTDVGAHPEAVEDGVNGFIVPRGDVTALAGRLEQLVDDPALRRSMGTRGRAIAEERFDAHRNALAVLDVMKEAARCAV